MSDRRVLFERHLRGTFKKSRPFGEGNISLASPFEQATMKDASSSYTSAEEYKTQRNPRDKRELLEMEKSRSFYTKGISQSITKWDIRIALVEKIGEVLQKLGEKRIDNIVKEAQGNQTLKAASVLMILQRGISDGTIQEKYQDDYSLSRLGNYLLFGRKIDDDQKLSTIGKKLWTDYEGAQKQLDKKNK